MRFLFVFIPWCLFTAAIAGGLGTFLEKHTDPEAAHVFVIILWLFGAGYGGGYLAIATGVDRWMLQ